MFPVASPSPKLGLGVAAVWEELVVTKTAKKQHKEDNITKTHADRATTSNVGASNNNTHRHRSSYLLARY
jgi:hypothetical protein